MNTCPHCGDPSYRYNVVSERKSKAKYLRAGCCDSPLRPCPNPSELLRCSHLSLEEQDYLKRLVELPWFSGAVATNLLAIEAKVQTSTSVEVVA